MTRQDFELIAAVFKEAAEWIESDPGVTPDMVRRQLGEDMMAVCRTRYSGSASFDSQRFRNAAAL